MDNTNDIVSDTELERRLSAYLPDDSTDWKKQAWRAAYDEMARRKTERESLFEGLFTHD